jgi:hypothetical protein
MKIKVLPEAASAGRSMAAASIAPVPPVPTWMAATSEPGTTMIYILAIFLPPLALLLNGQPFAAIFNLALIVPCLFFGLIFHVLLLVPSLHAIIAVHLKREERRHRDIVEAIERHGPPPGWGR